MTAERVGGCGQCVRKRMATNLRRPQSEAIALVQAAGLEPLEPYKSAHSPWRCRCRQCGREVRPTFGNIRRGQLGCVYCANRGIAPDAQAIVYLLLHESWNAVKIGIALRGSDRLATHAARGWEPVRVWDGLNGDQARSIERHVLGLWRSDQLLLPVGVPMDLMPDGGYTETAPLHLVDVSQTVGLINSMLDSLAVAEDVTSE